MNILGIMIGGAVGALSRYGLATVVGTRRGFPTGILVVNLSGCFMAGLLAMLLADRFASFGPALTVGLLGAYTTLSTFSVDTVRLMQAGKIAWAVTNIATSVVGGLLATLAGMALARAIWR